MPTKLMVATPAYGGKVHVDYLHSVMSFKTLPGLEVSCVTLGNDSLITRARNNLFSMFVHSDADYMFFMDADIGFSQDSLQKLLNHRLDIVCGTYRLKNPEVYLVTTKTIDTSQFPLVEVEHSGTGLMLISKKLTMDVVEWAKKTNNVYTDNMVYTQNTVDEKRREIYDVFKTEIDTEKGIYLSEDYYFCKLVRELGYKIYVDFSCPSAHNGDARFIYTPEMVTVEENPEPEEQQTQEEKQSSE